jgi:phytoene desaturase (3,4-didehydrolycopene-forming)
MASVWTTLTLLSGVQPVPRAPQHVVVVGAGMSGLAVAGRLARRGHRVTIVEKNERARAGGRLGEQVLTAAGGETLRFETGASLMLLPRVYARTFATLGLELPGPLARVDPSYRVFLGGGRADNERRGPVDLGSADGGAALREWLALEVEEPDAARKVGAFFTSARANLACGLPLFIEGDVREGMAALPAFAREALRFWPLQNQAAQLRALFPSAPRLRALCSFGSLYVGLSPYAAPAVFSLLPAIECGTDAPDAAAFERRDNAAAAAGARSDADPSRARALPLPAEPNDFGVWYPHGGFAAVARALADGVEAMAAVECRYGVACARVLTSADGASAGAGAPAATGVELESGEVLRADAVVVTADLAAAEPRLLGPTLSRSGYDGRDGDGRGDGYSYSTSSVTFLWAVRRRPKAGGGVAAGGAGVAEGEAESDVLRHHNVFLATHAARAGADADDDDPFRAAWDAILPADGSQGHFPPRTPAGAPVGGAHMYVCVSARTDASACSAPTLLDNLMVLVPVPALDERLTDAQVRAEVDRWVAAARELALGALEAAGCAHVRADIEAEELIDPLEWRRRYGLRRGAVFGLSHSLAQLSVFRPAQASSRVRGLFFAGASTAPGNGVPLVLISAEQVERKVARHLGV